MYIDSVMNYTGSKFKLLEQLLPHFDYTKSNFVDLFCGGGSVYINILDKYEKVFVNDIITDLIGIHNLIMESDNIIEETKYMCRGLKEDQEKFIHLRSDYNKNPSPSKLWALILSCNSNLIRFNQSGKFNQTWGKRTWNSNTDKKVNEFKEHIRHYSEKVTFLSKPFNDVNILDGNHMIYIDPPYGYIKGNNGGIVNKQISEAGYNSFYYMEDDENLYDYCHKINNTGASFMISGVLEHGGERSWLLDKLILDGFKFKELKYDYNKVNKSGEDKKTKEIIVMNY